MSNSTATKGYWFLGTASFDEGVVLTGRPRLLPPAIVGSSEDPFGAMKKVRPSP